MIRTVTRCRHCESVDVDGLVLDPGRRTIAYDGRSVHLAPTWLTVLELLLKADGLIVTQGRIEHALWGDRIDGGPAGVSALVKVYVHRARRILAYLNAPVRIVTVRGDGYRLEADETPARGAEQAEEAETCPA